MLSKEIKISMLSTKRIIINKLKKKLRKKRSHKHLIISSSEDLRKSVLSLYTEISCERRYETASRSVQRGRYL